MPPVTAIKAPPPPRKVSLAPSRRKVARAGRPAVHDEIPASFLQGLKDIAEGRVVDMEKALHEPYPG
jgi:hypothetical protein